MINEHLLCCEKIKMKNYEYFIEIRDFFTIHEMNYKLNDLFEDYGLKRLVRLIRSKVEELGKEIYQTP